MLGSNRKSKQNRLATTACVRRRLPATPALFLREKKGGRKPNSAAWRRPLAGEMSQLTIVPIDPMTIMRVKIGVSASRPKTRKKLLNSCMIPEMRLISFSGKTNAIDREPNTMVRKMNDAESSTALGKFFLGLRMSLTWTPDSSIPKKEAMMAMRETQLVDSVSEGIK